MRGTSFTNFRHSKLFIPKKVTQRNENWDLSNQKNDIPINHFYLNQLNEQKVTALALRSQPTALAVIRPQPSTALDIYKTPKTEIAKSYPKSIPSETNLFVLKPYSNNPKEPSCIKLVNQFGKEPGAYELGHYNAGILVNKEIYLIGYLSHQTKAEMKNKLIRTLTIEIKNLKDSNLNLKKKVDNLKKICETQTGDFVLNKQNQNRLASFTKNLSAKKKKYQDKENELEQLKKKSWAYVLISDTDLEGKKEKQYLHFFDTPRVPLGYQIENYGEIDLEKSCTINQGEIYNKIIEFLSTHDFKEKLELRLPLDLYADKTTGLPSSEVAASIAEHTAKKSNIVRHHTTLYLRTHEDTHVQMVFKASTIERIRHFGKDPQVQNGERTLSPEMVRRIEKPRFKLPRGKELGPPKPFNTSNNTPE